MSALSPQPKRWDIFCAVVDNFGDIGVCWRLARQLALEHGMTVRLWVDDLAAFARLCPGVQNCSQQWQSGVEVRHWHAAMDWGALVPADVVIEAFACATPDAYVTAMQQNVRQGQRAPLWLNLEYLTAESWAAEYHRLPSVEPRTGLRKYFFFPGFVPETGGLLREAELFEQRDALQTQAREKAAILAQIDVSPAPEALLISLFAYENEALAGLLQALAAGERSVHLLVPEGRITGLVERWLGEPLCLAQPIQRAALTVQAIPFVAQPDYDRVLWCCDLNCVRGEDSLVRALWAGRPLLWHCYPQAEGVHLLKMQALLDLYCRDLATAPATTLAALWRAWNEGQALAVQQHWPHLLGQLPELSRHAKHYASVLNQQPDLVSQMLQFYAELV